MKLLDFCTPEPQTLAQIMDAAQYVGSDQMARAQLNRLTAQGKLTCQPGSTRSNPSRYALVGERDD